MVNVYDEDGATQSRSGPATAAAEPLAPALLDRLVDLTGAAAVYVKYRQREASRVEDEDLPALAPTAPVAGRAAEGAGSTDPATPETAALGEYVAHEDGLAYLVRPGEGWNPGLFPDMREMRGRVRAWAAGQRVLNTFAYTCGFGVAAHAGGAAHVVNLDVSWPLLERGRANYRANGLTPQPEDFLYGDTFDWLPRLNARHELLRPDHSRSSGLRAHQDPHLQRHARLWEIGGRGRRRAGSRWSLGGLLSTWPTSPGPASRTDVVAGLDQAWRAAEIVGRYGVPALDFPALPGREGYLKILVARLT